MATTDYLADPEDLAAWLGVPASDAKLRQALAAASSRFRGAVRHHVSFVADDTTVLDGNGKESLLLPAAPVTAIASVMLDGEALTYRTDYDWSADGFLRRVGRCWPDRLRCVDVVWSHGYEPIPEDIAEVVLDQARAQYAVRPGLTSMTVGGQSVAFGAQASIGVTAQWTTMVEKYRLNHGDAP
ncbi:mobile element protein [Streptomyces sp. TRM75561]|uniref:mobile element protein n=1 Tax=Streptomyces sp. TRM75561 TaxID=2975269 RepID=UPI00244CD24F|nr:mobile element protein [Streptomyces sp. TRM75561]MDH3037922.1 mobile element protein [Streptomyces sp. TRM75561]